jgi:hypothetical protein
MAFVIHNLKVGLVAEYLGILNDMSLFYCWRLFVIWVTGALAPVVISAVWWVTCQ